MPACCVSFQYTADTQCLCMQEGGSIPAGCAEQVSDAVPCPLRRQEELDPAAQGTARPQLGRVQQPGERHHPGDRQVRPRDGAAGRAGPARRPLPATTTAASHLRHRHAAASCGHELLPAGGAPAGGAPGARLATPCAPPTPGACVCCPLTWARAHRQPPGRTRQSPGAADLALWRRTRLSRCAPRRTGAARASPEPRLTPTVRLAALAAPRRTWSRPHGLGAPGQQLHTAPRARACHPGRCAQPGSQGLGLALAGRCQWRTRSAGLCAFTPLIQLVTLARRPVSLGGPGRAVIQTKAMPLRTAQAARPRSHREM